MEVLQTFNSVHKDLVFEMEEAVDGQLNTLDLSVKATVRGLVIGFYRKSARSDIFLNSAKQKVQIVANERERILMRCQTSEDKEREMKNLDDRLKRNGFSDREIKSMWRKNRSKKSGEYVAASSSFQSPS